MPLRPGRAVDPDRLALRGHVVELGCPREKRRQDGGAITEERAAAKLPANDTDDAHIIQVRGPQPGTQGNMNWRQNGG